jgi:hypothetical protein
MGMVLACLRDFACICMWLLHVPKAQCVSSCCPHVACISEVHALGAGLVSACVGSQVITNWTESWICMSRLARFSLTLMYLHSSSRIES